MEHLEGGWVSGGGVIWKDLECRGERYVIAGGPRGVFLWTRGNGGIDIPTALLSWLWSAVVGATARTNVVKVRRRRRAGLHVHALRREFPASIPLLECVKTVENEVRGGQTPGGVQP